MALEKIIKLRHEVEPTGTVFVEEITTVTDDGAVVGSSNHRKRVDPGDDYGAEDASTKAICAAVQTPEVIAAWKAAQPAPQEVSE